MFCLITVWSVSLTVPTDNTLGGGSHIAKIFGVLEYLDGMAPSTDDELIMMMDAYGTDFR